MKRVVVTNPFLGLVGMQVCTEKDATDEEILKVCNKENRAGTSNGWTRVIRRKAQVENSFLLSESALPIKCADDENRLHFVVVC